MSQLARPDALAFRELEVLVRNLGEELARFRQRALQAEARLKQIAGASGGGGDAAAAEARVAALEAENAALAERLAQATERAQGMLDRVRFLRQQHVMEGET
ncbi:MAG: hypothetical protein K2X99_12075 [Gemmatimonadaceae bacterium]|nr:hypothetical protein [Gemmatimonadaceae bacterium]